MEKNFMNRKIFKFGLISMLALNSSCEQVKSFFISSEASVQHGDHAHDSIKSYYTCAMHPNVKQDKPGKCPICHMTLTKVEVEEANMDEESSNHSTSVNNEKPLWQCEKFPDVTSEVEEICPIDGTPMIKKPLIDKAGKVIAKVKLRKSQMKHFKPDFFPVSTMVMRKNIRLLGSVLQSEEKESKIPARIGGRVEKVFVKSTGSLIQKGDPVLNIYSPKLITAGEEYLVARRSYLESKTSDFKDLMLQSEQRLKLWGIKPFQYKNWFKSQKVPKNITIFSPANGIVRKRNAVVGKYFKEGQNFFELSDLSRVWVEMDVYEQDASLVSIGQKVSMEFTSLPGEPFTGEIDFIDPVLNSTSRTLKIRTTISNTSGKLKPGMVADASLTINFPGKHLVVPRTAMIDTGKRKVVWVKITDKLFQAKTVLTGYESEGYVEVKEGLMEGEMVVIEGSFLLDAQAQLFGGYESINSAPNAAHQH
jgi:hypothetical protein